MSAVTKWCPIVFLKSGLICKSAVRCKHCVEIAAKKLNLDHSVTIKKFYHKKQYSDEDFLRVNHEELKGRRRVSYLTELKKRARESVK